MKPVSDPSILAQLDDKQPVTDPAVLAQLEQGASPSSVVTGGFNPITEGILQGATFGFSDEIQSGAGALTDVVGGLLQGDLRSPGDIYDANMQYIKQQRDAYREQNPATSLGLEVGGGLMTGGALAKTAAKTAPGFLPQFLNYAKEGAKYGAISGAGFADQGLENRLTGAGLGATVGGVIGGAVPVAKQMVSGTFRGLTAPFRKPETYAARKLSQAISRDDTTPQQVSARLSKLGPEATIADAAGENVLGLARSATAQPGKAKNIASRVLNVRQLGRNNRVTEVINGALGDGDDYYNTLRRIETERTALAKPLYEEAYKVRVPPSKEMTELFKRPAMKEAWKRAQVIAANEGHKLPKMAARDEAGKIAGMVDVPDMRTMDYIKRGLDDVISDHVDDFGRIKGDTGRSVQALKGTLLERLDKINPAYKKARQAWAGNTENMRAMETGRTFLRDDSEMTAAVLRKLSDSEREYFRVGAARAIRDKILSSPDGGDAYKRIFGNEMIRERLKSVFPNDRSFRTFKSQMLKEAQFHRTKSTVLGGSPTARIEAEKADFSVDAGAIEEALQGRPGTAMLRKVQNIFGGSGAPEEATEQLSRMLFSNSPAENQRVLSELQQIRGLLTPAQREILTRAMTTATVEQAGKSVAP